MKIEMYTKTVCPHCDKAKALFNLKNVSQHVELYNIEKDTSRLKEMLERSGGRKTVPQKLHDFGRRQAHRPWHAG